MRPERDELYLGTPPARRYLDRPRAPLRRYVAQGRLRPVYVEEGGAVLYPLGELDRLKRQLDREDRARRKRERVPA